MTEARAERIFHVATRDDWQEAVRTGSYATSTLGRTLEEEGFIHACRRDQVTAVFNRYYSEVREPLVLLTIAPERLEAEVREEAVGPETYPHIYGPITPTAVVAAAPLDRRGRAKTLTGVFLEEMAKRMAFAVLLMAAIALVVLALHQL